MALAAPEAGGQEAEERPATSGWTLFRAVPREVFRRRPTADLTRAKVVKQLTLWGHTP